MKVDELENREISKLKDALSKSRVSVSEMESKLEIANKSNKNFEEKLSKTQLDNKNAKLENEKKLKEFEIDLQVSCDNQCSVFLRCLFVERKKEIGSTQEYIRQRKQKQGTGTRYLKGKD